MYASPGPYVNLHRSSLRRNNEGYYSAISFNDSYFDGKPVTLDFKAQVSEPFKKTYVVYLRHLSKDYYNYLKTVGLQSTTAGDPFAQPVLLENNITMDMEYLVASLKPRKQLKLTIDMRLVCAAILFLLLPLLRLLPTERQWFRAR
ncbi:MAG: DUF4249 family protein [Bacteroidota bacterium]